MSSNTAHQRFDGAIPKFGVSYGTPICQRHVWVRVIYSETPVSNVSLQGVGFMEYGLVIVKGLLKGCESQRKSVPKMGSIGLI